MIFIGRNFDISIPFYYDHHWYYRTPISKWWYNHMNARWNRLKEKNPAWGILEWIISHRKGICLKCAKRYVHSETIYYIDNVKQTKEIRMNRVRKLIIGRGSY